MSNDNDSDIESGGSGDEGAELITPIDIPDKPAFLDANATAPVPFNVEKDCAFLLLEARMILRAIMEHRLRQERILSGNLTVDEIQNLLRSQKEDSDKDWITQIQELKRKLVAEVRRNHGLEGDLQKLDKKIALLIKNRGNIQEVLAKTEHKKKKGTDNKPPELFSDQKKELYQNLFYLLQTEPKYLANLLYLCSPEEMHEFLDTVILTLFGDAYSPREEFLILSLFKLTLLKELKSLGAVGDLLSAETVVLKMVLAYNKRKLGSEYLKTTLAPLIQQVVKQQDIMLDMRPTAVHQWLINQKEIRTGEKSTLDRNLAEDKIMELPEVVAVLKTRAEQLIATAKQFLDALINSLPRLPYGLRWICKQIQQIAGENFPQSTQSDILRVTGYLVYYRFINLMIVTPMEFKVVDVRDLNVNTTKNLVAVAKVLQQLFYLSTFTEKYMAPVNEWITANMDRARRYLEDLLDVPDPEDFLKVDRYIELTQMTKPVIIISYHEVSQTHNLVHKHLESLGLPKDDSLRIIMKELDALGPVPDIPKDDDREVQLTLTNRFETHVEEDIHPDKQLYTETKELAIKALSGIPVEPRPEGGGPPVLSETLQRGLGHADKTGNSPLHVTITKTLENLKKLEEKGLITSSDNYAGFLREVALEVANRQSIREQQKKEVRRLTATVKNLQTIQQYMNEQIRQYNDYLEVCKEKHYAGKKKKKSKKSNPEEKVKPVKYSYKQLKSKGIIVSVDESLESVIKKLDFVISSKKAGVFNVVARLGPAEAKNVRVEVDELLECQANGISTIDREGIVLDVNMTIHLLNKMLTK
eukprot:Phypoly_transcript_02695.p1 GENE.Phypoly_transcript_02695~~Phypoly_transcript_02695.p1  ORF type:complete len:813 (+),score=183.58 Phypoly_transcript_02695:90-2528(+)